ncbi:hypothetical protein MXD63_33975 [Frankia sp. Cpl3]|uniref:transposase n=1 Tax=Parafrankia colletiae TaxID=573497 RepID=UPI001041C135|nr:transposase [Parafrankia colletiae]MCK9905019.1 hypothetical protein [Frankia sp. Cpl3]
MGRPSRYPPPLRAQAARIRPQHRSTWQAITTVAAAFGMSAETLRGWVREAEIASDLDRQLRREQQAELRRLNQEVTRLRQTLRRIQDTRPTPATSDPRQGTTRVAESASASVPPRRTTTPPSHSTPSGSATPAD